MTGTISTVMRAIIDRVYPVGIIVDFAVEMDPNSAVGFGTQWQRIADGRALIASDASHPVGWAGGAATHKLTASEMPAHTHSSYMWRDNYAGTDTHGFLYTYKDGATEGFVASGYIAAAGGNAAHNNMQPSLAVARWKRVA